MKIVLFYKYMKLIILRLTWGGEKTFILGLSCSTDQNLSTFLIKKKRFYTD